MPCAGPPCSTPPRGRPRRSCGGAAAVGTVGWRRPAAGPGGARAPPPGGTPPPHGSARPCGGGSPATPAPPAGPPRRGRRHRGRRRRCTAGSRRRPRGHEGRRSATARRQSTCCPDTGLRLRRYAGGRPETGPAGVRDRRRSWGHARAVLGTGGRAGGRHGPCRRGRGGVRRGRSRSRHPRSGAPPVARRRRRPPGRRSRWGRRDRRVGPEPPAAHTDDRRRGRAVAGGPGPVPQSRRLGRHRSAGPPRRTGVPEGHSGPPARDASCGRARRRSCASPLRPRVQ
jgi:hypothetical protein